MDKVAAETDDLLARFAGLVHDLGKGLTPAEMLPHHYGHEVRGVDVLHSWNRRMTLPKRWVQAGKFVISEHMRAARLTKPGKIVELLLKAAAVPLSVEGFQAIIRADHHSLPDYLEEAPSIITALLQVDGCQAPKTLKGPEIGSWVRNQQIKVFRNYRYKEI